MRFENKVLRGGILIAVLACVATISGCDSFVESNGQTSRATIGLAGGALHLGVFSLAVPPHALDHTVTLSVSRATFEGPDGHAYVLDPVDAVFDSAAPATITITYDSAIYQHPAEVFVATYISGAWHTLPGTSAPEAGVAQASTIHTGTFAIMNCPGGVCPTASSDASTGH